MPTGRTVDDAARFVAGRLDLVYPQHKQKLFKILSYANQHAWKKGVWRGMTREFFTIVRPDNTVCNPHGYSLLQKVNLNSKPVTIRDSYFQFHRNGNGSKTECCGKDWTTDVHDVGYSPVLFQPFRPESCECDTPTCQMVNLGVYSNNVEEHGLFLTVYGCYADGTPVWSYKERSDPNKGADCDQTTAQRLDTSKFEVKEGVDFPITNNLQIANNVFWGDIRHITKPPTCGAVEVVAYNMHKKETKMIARLEPTHRSSCYRLWRVPEICWNRSPVKAFIKLETSESCIKPCVHGLWKMDKPGEFTLDNELMIFDDDEALTALAIGANLLWFLQDPVKAAKYYGIGITSLNDDKEQNEAEAVEQPIQSRDPRAEATNRVNRVLSHY